MLVYRYQDSNHVGPFAHNGFNRRFAKLATAQDVGLMWRIGESASACESVDSLIAYFGARNSRDLESKGYRIAEYKVDASDVQVGSNQVVFNSNTAVLMQYID